MGSLLNFLQKIPSEVAQVPGAVEHAVGQAIQGGVKSAQPIIHQAQQVANNPTQGLQHDFQQTRNTPLSLAIHTFMNTPNALLDHPAQLGHQKNPIAGFLAGNIINPALRSSGDISHGIQKTGTALGEAATGADLGKSATKGLQGIGQLGVGALNSPLGFLAGGGKAVEGGVAGTGLLHTLAQGAKVGATYGGAYGIASGLKDGKNLVDQAKQAGLQGVQNAVGGAVLGGALSGAGYGVTKGIQKLLPEGAATAEAIAKEGSQAAPSNVVGKGASKGSKAVAQAEKQARELGAQPIGSKPDAVVATPKDTFYHGTSKADAESLVKNGFNPTLSSKGPNAESPYALFASSSNAAGSDHAAGTYGDSVVSIKPKGNVNLLDANSATWANTMGRSKGAADSAKIAQQLRQMGYDGIKEANGEVTILSPSKFSFNHSVDTASAIPQPKQRGLTTGIQQSPEFSPQLQKAVTSEYTPFTNKAATETTDQFMQQPLAQARDQVLTSLAMPSKSSKVASAFTGEFGKQEVANAGAVIKALDSQGDIEGAQRVHDLLAQKLTNAGQTSQAASLLYNRTPEGLKFMAQRDLGKAKVAMTPELQAQINAGIEAIKAAPDGSKAQALAQAKFQQMVGRHIPSSAGEKVVSLWKSGLLSAPITMVKVGVINPVSSVLEQAKDIPAAGVDRVASMFTGKRTMVAPNPTNLGAGFEALPGALSDAKTKLLTNLAMPGSSSIGIGELGSGTASHPLETTFGLNKAGEQSLPDKLTGGLSTNILRGYTQLASRTHGALSTLTYETRAAQSLAQSAQAEALNQGLKGAEKASFIKDFMTNPDNYGSIGKDALSAAQRDAEYATSQQKTALGQAASGFQHSFPGGQFIAPITRIPGAVATQVLNYSPAGFAKTAIQAGVDAVHGGSFNQREFSQGIGRAITGTGIMYLGTLLASQGRLSGTYPSDQTTKSRWQAANIPADSLYVGGKVTKNADGTFSYRGGSWQQIGQAGGPAGQALLVGGQIHDGLKSGGALGAASQGAFGGAKTVLDQPYLTGIAGVNTVLNDPAQSKQVVDQYAGSLVPNALKTFAVATDPLQRQTSVQDPIQSAKNAITNGIPGLREKNLPQVDVLGNKLARNNDPVTSFLNPFRPQPSRDTNLLDQFASVHAQNDPNTGNPLATPSQIAKKYKVTLTSGKVVPLTDAQRTQFIQDSGGLANTQLNKLIQTPQYNNAKPEDKSKMISDVFSAARTVTKSQIAGVKNTATNKDRAIAGGTLPSLPGQKQDKTPLNTYNTARQKYLADDKAGKINDLNVVTRTREMGKLRVMSTFDQPVVDFYNLSNQNRANVFKNNPTLANQLYTQAKQLDQQLVAAGLSTTKFKSVSGGSGSRSGGSRAKSVASQYAGINKTNPYGNRPNISGIHSTLARSSIRQPSLRTIASGKMNPPKVKTYTVRKGIA